MWAITAQVLHLKEEGDVKVLRSEYFRSVMGGGGAMQAITEQVFHLKEEGDVKSSAIRIIYKCHGR